MEKELYTVCAEGLIFFGKTNRFISHEMKNILAIISETLGLLNELVALSEEGGRKLEPGKLKSLSEGIIEEVERANTLVRDMNRFAHSVDEFICEVDITQCMALILQISRLNAKIRDVPIELTETRSHRINSSPFFVNNLLYHATYFALSHAASDKTGIRVSLSDTAEGVAIRFSGISPNTTQRFPDGKTRTVMNAISADAALDTAKGELCLSVTKEIFNNPIYYLMSNE